MKAKQKWPKIPPRQAGVPSYRKHTINGHTYAVVTLGGKDHYLGHYGTPESITRYDEVVARWLAAGRMLPEEQPTAALSVNEVLLKYVEHAARHYAARCNAAAIVAGIKRAVKPVRELFGTVAATGFGPKALQLVRATWVQARLHRKTVNERVAAVKACFRWAASEELIPGETWHALSAVNGLRRGDADVAEARKVKPVPDAFVEGTLPHLPAAVRAMVRLQQVTGMRPGEVCAMRTADVDMSGKLWVYRPRHHKTEELHGLEREVLIGPAGQAVLRPWLRPKLDEFLFQPREVLAEIRKTRRAQRKTPLKPAAGRSRSKRTHGKARPPGPGTRARSCSTTTRMTPTSSSSASGWTRTAMAITATRPRCSPARRWTTSGRRATWACTGLRAVRRFSSTTT
jgi:integrase